MPQYMLLLHDCPQHDAELSPDDIQSIIGEYLDWRAEIEAKGQLVGGEKLTDEGGKVLKLVDSTVHVTDGPFAEAKEVVGGYFAIRAESYEEAVEIAKGCPHLRYGERIEVRQVDDHGAPETP